MWVVGEVAQFGRGDYKSGEPQEDRLVPANQRLGDKQRADEHEWGNIIIRDKVKGFSQRFTGPTGVCRHPVRDRLFEGEKLIASDGESEDRSQQQRQRTCKNRWESGAAAPQFAFTWPGILWRSGMHVRFDAPKSPGGVP